MNRKKIPGKAICQCGKGKKYKNCCWNKKFEWVEEDGNIFKSIPIADELLILEKLKKRTCFGRYYHA